MDTVSTSSYVILGLILAAALTSLGFGLRSYWRRIEHGKPWFGDGDTVTRQSLLERINWQTVIKRGLMTERLLQRPVAGSFHSIMFIGALLLIFGHAVFILSFLGIPVYGGWFGYVFMKLGREIGGIMLFIGVAFFLLRRLSPPDRLTAGCKTRRGFERGEIILLVIVVAGYITESCDLPLNPPQTTQNLLVAHWALCCLVYSARMPVLPVLKSCGGCTACSAVALLR